MYVNTEYQSRRAEADRRNAVAQAAALEHARLDKERDDNLVKVSKNLVYMTEQCKVGATSYAELTKGLTAAAKAKTKAPDCELSFE